MASCLFPGCSKPTWNGKPGYCSKTHKEQAGVMQTMCSLPGCGQPTFNGLPGYCTREHKKQGDAMGIVPGKPAPVVSQQGSQVMPGTPKFQDIEHQFNVKWDSTNCGNPPTIKSIWFVADPKLVHAHEDYAAKEIGNVKCYGAGVNPGNKQRRFHKAKMVCADTFNGTPCGDPTCAVCGIITSGFLLSKVGGAGQTYGKGIYSSPTPSYGLTWKGGVASKWTRNKATIVVSVACGVTDMTSSKAALLPGTHSRVADSTTGNPADDELVVYDERAIIPKFLIIYE